MKIEGLVVPLITPLRKDESLDEVGLERLVAHVMAGGVNSIFVLGSCGEFPALEDSTRERLVQCVCQQTNGRVSVLAGIADTSTRRTIERGKRLARLGADGVVVTAPYYYAHTQEELIAHFSNIAHAVDAPVFLYNIPRMVNDSIEPETVHQLAQVPGIIGLKDSAENMIKFQQFLAVHATHPEFGVYQGAELLAAQSVALGADGVVMGLANVVPGLCLEVYNAARSGDFSQAWTVQKRLMELSAVHEQGSSWLAGLKAAVSALGLCGRTTIAPFEPLTDQQYGCVRQILMELELL